MWLSVCVSGEEDVAGVCALPGRAGEAHSSMHAQHAGSSRVRARRSAAGGKRTETWLLERHHHAMIMTWARWTRRVKAARAATSLAARDAHDRPIGHLGRVESACKFERTVLFESPSTS
jgi:hypothetical protein